MPSTDASSAHASPRGGPIRLYGFRSCDMVRDALKWLDSNRVAHEFFDYRKDALAAATVDDWFERAGWEAVFNRNSTTFKELPEREKTGLDARKAKRMILAQTNLIKRPVLDTGRALLFGFKPEPWARALGSPRAGAVSAPGS